MSIIYPAVVMVMVVTVIIDNALYLFIVKKILKQHFVFKEGQVLSLKSLGALHIYQEYFSEYINRYTSVHYVGNVSKITLSFYINVISITNIAAVMVTAVLTDNFLYVGIALFFSMYLPPLYSNLLNSTVTAAFQWKVFNYCLAASTLQESNDSIKVDDPAFDEFKSQVEENKIKVDRIIHNFKFLSSKGQLVGITGPGNKQTLDTFFGFNKPFSKDTLVYIKHKKCFVPSNPQIFAGKLKNSLNPEGCIKEFDLWTALSKTDMSYEIMQLPFGLVSESNCWDNIFSVYHRQLLFLSIQIAVKSKFIVIELDSNLLTPLEEADILKKAKAHLPNSTIFFLSNRLRTVLTSDLLMVFKQGIFMEFDTPFKLLHKPYSCLLEYINEVKDPKVRKTLYNIPLKKRPRPSV